MEGMTCASCAETVKSALSEVKGVRDVKVQLKNGEVEVGFENTSSLASSELLTVLEKNGYEGTIVVSSSAGRKE
ncbi:MAG: heavy metal-associated domain-containing protein [Candidatus Brocadiales bacterium]|nr:heavy metal-associated domain-containing protein [Candidatus Brocadiales bacterium]